MKDTEWEEEENVATLILVISRIFLYKPLKLSKATLFNRKYSKKCNIVNIIIIKNNFV